MQITIRSFTRRVLLAALPASAVLSMALFAGVAGAQSGSGSGSGSSTSGSGSSQSNSSQTTSQSDSDGEQSGAGASRSRSQSDASGGQSDRSQSQQNESARSRSNQSQRSQDNQQDDRDLNSSQRQRSSSGLGQSNRDRSDDNFEGQQRRSSSGQSDRFDSQQGQSGDREQSERRRAGLGQSNRDRGDDDFGSSQSSDRFSDDDVSNRSQSSRQRSFSQSERQRSQFRDDDSRWNDSQNQISQDRGRQDSRGQQSRDSRDQSGSRSRMANREMDVEQLGLEFSDQSDELVVAEVDPQSAAARAGLRPGDEIVTINGRRVHSHDELARWIQSSPNSRLNVVVIRNGREMPIMLTTTQSLRSGQQFVQDDFDYSSDSEYSSRASLGVVLDPRYQQGAMVDRVYRDSPAERAGLQRGDYIIAVDRQRVNSPQDLVRIISNRDPGAEIEIEFTRRQRDTAAVTLGSQGDRQDGSFSLTQQRGYSQQQQQQQQRSASRPGQYDRFENESENRDDRDDDEDRQRFRE